MTNILVFLPKEFLSYSKFERKISRITSSFENFELCSAYDPNNFLTKFSSANPNCEKINIVENWESLEYTHVVIFDDGEIFPNETLFFQKNETPLRVIKIKITRVINIHHHPEFQKIKKSDEYEYIGRGSIWGNPYAMNGAEQESREDVISKFEYDFHKDILMKAKKIDAQNLAGKRLGCFCKPHDCHGDIIARYLNSLDDEK
ncbi:MULTISPECIES: DUF4326 domain-containing protein [unclassified Acinetobacter]|uniref:DUF4326 domain-containing protein n=1 Tax=unclassified Acinetobacter TaxID=196816 RepID=UPI0015D15821|nr:MULTISPECIES: DUF4326 domain-containing protein [unclassified Acinetobacter]